MTNENTTPTVLVDLDGTLAESYGYKEGVIGKPIWSIVDVCKYHIGLGHKVKIFTARADKPVDVAAIKEWLIDSAGLPVNRMEYERLRQRGTPAEELEVTNMKDLSVIAIYDDKAYHVGKNNGKIVGLPSLTNSRKPETALPKIVPFKAGGRH